MQLHTILTLFIGVVYFNVYNKYHFPNPGHLRMIGFEHAMITQSVEVEYNCGL